MHANICSSSANSKNKTQGSASQILANHGTTFNLYAILDRLDKTYADHDGMKNCIQGKKSLRVFHDETNKYYHK